MKRQVTTGYVFNPTNKTLDLSALPGANAASLLAVIDTTNGAYLYLVGVSGLGYASVASGPVFTLQASTAGDSSGDALLIIYDDGSIPAIDASVQALTNRLGLGSLGTATSQVVQTLAQGGTYTLASNTNRRRLKWMVTGAGAVRVAVGPTAPGVGAGMLYPGAGSDAEGEGGSESFEGPYPPTDAFTFVALAATSLIIWEG